MVFSDCYPYFPDANTSIDTLNVPDEGMNAMKRVGIKYIGDVLDVYARLPGPGIRISSKCLSLIFRQVIVLDGCPWRDEIEDWLVKSVENH